MWGADKQSENGNYILRISLSWGTALIYKGKKTKQQNQNSPFETGTVREPLLIVLHSKTTKHKTHRNEHQHSTNYSSGVNMCSFHVRFSPLWPYLQHGSLIVISHLTNFQTSNFILGEYYLAISLSGMSITTSNLNLKLHFCEP